MKREVASSVVERGVAERVRLKQTYDKRTDELQKQHDAVRNALADHRMKVSRGWGTSHKLININCRLTMAMFICMNAYIKVLSCWTWSKFSPLAFVAGTSNTRQGCRISQLCIEQRFSGAFSWPAPSWLCGSGRWRCTQLGLSNNIGQ